MQAVDVLEMEPVSSFVLPVFEPRPRVRNVQRDLSAYCTSIVQRLEEDLVSYRNAESFVPGVEEREILGKLAERKSADIESIIAQSPDAPALWRETLKHQASSLRYWLDVEFSPILSLMGALCFAYQREYRTLHVFERFCRMAETQVIEAIFDSAVWRQRETIFWLDAATAPARAEERDRAIRENCGYQGASWALTLA